MDNDKRKLTEKELKRKLSFLASFFPLIAL